MEFQCDNGIEARRLDLILIEREERHSRIVDIAIAGNIHVVDKEKDKADTKIQGMREHICGN